MSDTWFISDTHFGHANILDYEPIARPFETIEAMNEAIIERWNSAVKPYDKVFHLSDFCFGRKNIEIAGRLNGNKRLIMGNHDIYGAQEYLKYFKSVHGVMFWNKCILTHMPVHSKQLAHRAILNLHGHMHSKKVKVQGLIVDLNEDDPRYMNFSVEQNNLTPIAADFILNHLRLYEAISER